MMKLHIRIVAVGLKSLQQETTSYPFTYKEFPHQAEPLYLTPLYQSVRFGSSLQASHYQQGDLQIKATIRAGLLLA